MFDGIAENELPNAIVFVVFFFLFSPFLFIYSF